MEKWRAVTIQQLLG